MRLSFESRGGNFVIIKQNRTLMLTYIYSKQALRSCFESRVRTWIGGLKVQYIFSVILYNLKKVGGTCKPSTATGNTIIGSKSFSKREKRINIWLCKFEAIWMNSNIRKPWHSRVFSLYNYLSIDLGIFWITFLKIKMHFLHLQHIRMVLQFVNLNVLCLFCFVLNISALRFASFSIWMYI